MGRLPTELPDPRGQGGATVRIRPERSASLACSLRPCERHANAAWPFSPRLVCRSEAHLPFAGLHQLLRPVRERATELPEIQRAALDAAFGLTHEAAPEHYRIAMAVLDLVSEAATDAPLLLVVEDSH